MVNPITIGLTGGIGSGKTTVAHIFLAMGYPVYFSDDRAKRLMVNDEKLMTNIKHVFGEDIYLNNQLDRAKLGNIVFNDKAMLAKLNALVHPAVALDFKKWCAKQKASIVFKEAAVLFETGLYKQMNYNVLITCPKPIRVSRVMKRDNVTKQQVLARMNNQWEEDKKAKLADFLIDNSGSELVVPQVQHLLNGIEKT